MSKREHLIKLLATHQRTLDTLETQAAKYGNLAVPPHIVHQIEDAKSEIAKIEIQLSTPAPPLPGSWHDPSSLDPRQKLAIIFGVVILLVIMVGGIFVVRRLAQLVSVSTTPVVPTALAINTEPAQALPTAIDPTEAAPGVGKPTLVSTAIPSPAPSLTTAPIPTVAATAAQEHSASIAVDHTENSNTHAQVTLTISSIDFLPNGRMRWNLLYDNQSKDDLTVQIAYGQSYLSDESGNHYEILSDESGVRPTDTFRAPLQSLTKRQHWLEFPAPKAGAKTFTMVYETGPSGADVVSFRPFLITLTYDTKDVPSGQLPSTPDGVTSIALGQKQDSATHSQVALTISSIDFLPNGHMRWNLLYNNQSKDDLTVQIAYGQSYLSDESGNHYEILSDESGVRPIDTFRAPLQSLTKRQHWLEFPAPKAGAKTFTMVYETGPSGADVVSFRPFLITLTYDTKDVPSGQLPSTPDGVTSIALGQKQDSATHSQVALTISSIDFLPNGHMRWNLLYNNQSKDDLTVQIAYGQSYLSDESGNHYEILSDESGVRPIDTFRAPLQSLTKRQHWLEFPAPKAGAKTFTMVYETGPSGADVVGFPSFVVTIP